MTEVFINSTIVDIDQDIIMSLNYAIADILQPDKRSTAFSKTIKFPGTKNNNILFGHIFDISKEIDSENSLINFSPDFNPNLKTNIKIFKDHLLQFDGIVQLLQINRNAETYEYETASFGSLKNIMLNFEGHNIEELDMSEYNHAFTKDRMTESWATKIQKNGADYVNFVSVNPKGEGYVYPTVDYGYTNNPTTLRLDKSFPAIYVREYMKKLFLYAGFSWTSNFIDSNFFKRLIILFNKADALLNEQEILNRSFLAKIKGQVLTYGANKPQTQGSETFAIQFNNESTSGAFDTTNQYTPGITANYIPGNGQTAYVSVAGSVGDKGVYIAKKKGYYDISTYINFNVNFFTDYLGTPKSSTSRLRISIIKGKQGTSAITTLATTGDIDKTGITTGFNGVLKASNISVEQGDLFYVTIYFKQSNNPNVQTAFPEMILEDGSSFYNTPVTTPILIGDLMYLNSAIPKGVPMKDFFTSIIKMFNLYVQPDPDSEANLLIEPLIDFYANNQLIDWSEKVDYSKPIIIKPCSAIEGKEYVFRYKPDKDYYNEDYRNRYDLEYGERNISIANDFVKGKKIVEPIFSATPSYGIVQNEMVIPRIVSISKETGAVSPYESNIRILYYGGVKSAGGSWTWSYGANNYTQTTYAYAGHLDDPFSPTIDLLFDAPKALYWGAPSNIGSSYTNNNLFNKYYSQFIIEITDKNSKIITVSVRLRPIDVFLLSFKNFIHIDGIDYRLNKILDYNPDNEETCKAELLKIKGGRAFLPSVIDVDDTSQSPILFDILEGSKNEIRSASAISIIQKVDGGKNAVIGLLSSVNINIINGGKN